jgi:hypothetical protein
MTLCFSRLAPAAHTSYLILILKSIANNIWKVENTVYHLVVASPHFSVASSSPYFRKLLTSFSQAPHLVLASSSPRGRKLLTSRKQAPHLAETSSSPRRNFRMSLIYSYEKFVVHPIIHPYGQRLELCFLVPCM